MLATPVRQEQRLSILCRNEASQRFLSDTLALRVVFLVVRVGGGHEHVAVILICFACGSSDSVRYAVRCALLCQLLLLAALMVHGHHFIDPDRFCCCCCGFCGLLVGSFAENWSSLLVIIQFNHFFLLVLIYIW